MPIHPFRALYDVIVYTEQYEDKYNFIFLLGAGIYGCTSNSSALYFSIFIHAHDIAFLNHDDVIYVSLECFECYGCICR